MLTKGQGVVESVIAVGILALVLGGAVILIVMGSSNRQKSFDRRKAMELATIVTEELVSSSQNTPGEFWKLTNTSSQSRSGFDGYTYSVGFTNVVDAAKKCGIGRTDCAETVIKIDWQGKDPQTLYFNRFFSKND